VSSRKNHVPDHLTVAHAVFNGLVDADEFVVHQWKAGPHADESKMTISHEATSKVFEITVRDA
jgi:hypothetical protein